MFFSSYEELIRYKKVYIEMMARDGISNHDIAKKLGIPYDDFVSIVKKDKTLQILLEICREETDYEVENALLQLAKGYTYTETEKEVVNKPIIKNGVVVAKVPMIKTTTNRKVVPPDLNAIKHWQNNRQKGKWDRELTAKTNISIEGAAPVQIVDDIPDAPELPNSITGKKYD